MDKISIGEINLRKSESRRKFFNGLYAEYTGIIINDNGYIDSGDFNAILEDVNKCLNDDLDMERHFYSIGQWFLELNKNDESTLILIKKMLGEHWEAMRFQNLVRLGADIENASLSSIPRATLVGAFLYQKEKMTL